METSIWVVGVGPIIVNRQFLVDIGRRAVEWYLNGKSIPKDPRDALLLLYEDCGEKYYLFSKYMNQTMGNLMYEHVQRMHWSGAMSQVTDTYKIYAFSGKKNMIKAHLDLDLFDETLKRCGKLRVVSEFDIDKDTTLISVKKLF